MRAPSCDELQRELGLDHSRPGRWRTSIAFAHGASDPVPQRRGSFDRGTVCKPCIFCTILMQDRCDGAGWHLNELCRAGSRPLRIDKDQCLAVDLGARSPAAVPDGPVSADRCTCQQTSAKALQQVADLVVGSATLAQADGNHGVHAANRHFMAWHAPFELDLGYSSFHLEHAGALGCNPRHQLVTQINQHLPQLAGRSIHPREPTA